jgi:hypothetical protein
MINGLRRVPSSVGSHDNPSLADLVVCFFLDLLPPPFLLFSPWKFEVECADGRVLGFSHLQCTYSTVHAMCTRVEKKRLVASTCRSFGCWLRTRSLTAASAGSLFLHRTCIALYSTGKQSSGRDASLAFQAAVAPARRAVSRKQSRARFIRSR